MRRDSMLRRPQTASLICFSCLLMVRLMFLFWQFCPNWKFLEKRTKTSWVQKKLNVEETVALVLVQIWGLRHVPDHEWSLASGLRALSMIATAGMAIAVSLWLPHSRCKPVSPASNGHQGSYGVVREEVTRGYVRLPQQNTPSPFCTSLTPAEHLSVICKPLFWGISCQLIWVSLQKWFPWYLSTPLS